MKLGMLQLFGSLLLLACMICVGSPVDAQAIKSEDVRGMDPTSYVEVVRATGREPVKYLVDTFATRDLVLLGEEHGIRENCEFVASTLEPLYRQAGVRRFATEFVRSRNSERVNRLVTAPTYDHDLSLAIMRDYAWPTWGYREYMDILEAIWRINASLSEDADPLLIVPLDSDWSQHDLFFKDISPRDRMKMVAQREKHMIDALVIETLAPGRKALVHIGYLHSITSQGERLGTVLRKEYGKRVFQISFHHRFPEPLGSSTVCRFVERVVQEAVGRPIGFDVIGTPFALLQDPESKAFTYGGKRAFGDLAEGYIFLKPADEMRSVHWIDGFIVDSNFKEALEVAVKVGQADLKRDNDAAKLDARLKEVIESR